MASNIVYELRITHSVHCTIYPKRPSTCHEFTPSWSNGEQNEHCDKARQAYGLEPLTPEIWQSPDNHPEMTRAA